MYIHDYYNIDKAAEDKKNFDRNLMQYQVELESKKRVVAHEKHYSKYFDIITRPKKGTKATVKEEVVKMAKRYSGFFVLLSNEKMDSQTALEIYRNKDVVEKAFGNLKERLNMRPAFPEIHNELMV